jgi:hypothetical protein
MPFEIFRDSSYYDMWAVRLVGNRDFNQTMHVATEKEAELAVKCLNNLEEKFTSNNNKSMPCCPRCKTDYDVGVFHVCENCGHRWS